MTKIWDRTENNIGAKPQKYEVQTLQIFLLINHVAFISLSYNFI